MLQLTTSRLGATRSLTPAALLKTVRNDPGMTAPYYANRYFGSERAMAVNHMLWTQLKRHGRVTLDRSDGSDHPPRWYPLFETPKVHSVTRHNPEDEDLSVLRDMGEAPPQAPEAPPAPSASSPIDTEEVDPLRVESLVMHLVQQDPGHDIQHYIGLLPFQMRMVAPAAFRRLRENALLTRETTPQGTFVWR